MKAIAGSARYASAYLAYPVAPPLSQLLKQEYANLKFKDGESMEDFSLRLQTLINKLKATASPLTKRRRSPSTSTPCRQVHPDRSLHRDDAGLIHPHH